LERGLPANTVVEVQEICTDHTGLFASKLAPTQAAQLIAFP